MRATLAASLPLALFVPLASQPQWLQLQPGSSPGTRNSTAMAYDEARGAAVLYGGFRVGAGALSDTWEFDGATWAQRTPAANPGILNGHHVAYDSARSRTVLFGGARNTSLGVGETWQYDGTNWTLVAATGPQGRVNHQLCYDIARGVTVLFGGHVDYNAGPNLGDTWELAGAAWVQRSSTGPAQRTYHAMAYDTARRRTVLFGGRGDGNVTLNDTWEWDGATWTQRFPANSPPGRIDHEMAYDPLRRVCVTYSGFGAAADTWEWDGTNWAQRMTTTAPGSRYAYGFCYDWKLHRVLLLGGYQGGQRNDTWTCGEGIPASYVTSGAGCQGPNGVPAIAAATGSQPLLGETFTARCLNLSAAGLAAGILGASNTLWGSVPLPLELSPIGMPGCRLYVSFDFVFGLVNNNGAATWSVPIPNLVPFVAAKFHQQVANVAPGANPLGVIVSNYGTMTIGVR
jgi:hypothetical protein